ncbi:MAG: glycerol-3-phosphate dehydrogenase/oxidase [Bryobacteraceae bacterium]|nr:glycerol-3-phosphate dehydrogenase/oxidase [Bryobacteraceae bacterium]
MATRAEQLERLGRESFDVLILGGGVNGTGIARDLALRASEAKRPLTIGLIEKRHFASGTSGKNSQLIHGGLRYLKYLEFKLVHEALRERATLLEIAPHLVRPQPFLIPMYDWFSRVYYGTGLWVYDVLAGSRNIAHHRRLSREDVLAFEPTINADGLTGGALFYDCRVHAARFVVANMVDAVDHGVAAVNYVEAGKPSRNGEGWTVPVRDALGSQESTVRARKLIDTRGAWSGGESLRLVRGSHLIFPRLNASENAIAHFERDGRIIFLIPWGERNDLTLVGTTDVDHKGTADEVRISNEEIEYLCGIVKRLYPDAPAVPISAYSSLRPLVRDESDSPTSTSREHRIWNDAEGILRVAGGKYTTYRAMSEEAADLACAEVAPELKDIHVTAERPLPRLEQPVDEIERAVQREMAQRLADLMFVSTYWGYERRWEPESLEPIAARMGSLLGWDKARREEEVDAVLAATGLPPEVPA